MLLDSECGTLDCKYHHLHFLTVIVQIGQFPKIVETQSKVVHKVAGFITQEKKNICLVNTKF